jgi:site-specific DNA-cytosine methylase
MTDIFRRGTLERITWEDCRNSQTFPQDYEFLPNSANQVGYICGMSVPPVMIKRLVTRLIESGLFNYKLKNK